MSFEKTAKIIAFLSIYICVYLKFIFTLFFDNDFQKYKQFNLPKMNENEILKKYFDEMPFKEAVDFREKVISTLRVTSQTWRNWYLGNTIPEHKSKLLINLLAEEVIYQV